MKGIKEEYRKDFAALAAQCDKFAYDFLSQCQTPNEARDLLGRAGFLDEAMDANKKEVSSKLPFSQSIKQGGPEKTSDCCSEIGAPITQ